MTAVRSLLFPPFRLDLVNEALWQGAEKLAVRPKPLALLTYLVEQAGRLVPRAELRKAVWPTTYSSFQLHASSSVGAILVIAQWGRGAGRIQDSPLPSSSGLTQVKFAICE